MKAKVIKTGEVLEVYPTPTGWASGNLNVTRFFKESDLDFDYCEWEVFRREAAKDLGWISVKDRLPEEGHFVLTCVDDSGTPQSVGMALFLKDGTWWDGDMKVYVDYWMEVPKLKK